MSEKTHKQLINLEDRLKNIEGKLPEFTSNFGGIGMDQVGFVVYDKFYENKAVLKDRPYKDGKSLNKFYTTALDTYNTSSKQNMIDLIKKYLGVSQDANPEGVLVELKEIYEEKNSFERVDLFSKLKAIDPKLVEYDEHTIRLTPEMEDGLEDKLTNFFIEEEELVEAKKLYDASRGQLVGIYKANGENENGINSNLISMAYLPVYDSNINNVNTKDVINMLLSVGNSHLLTDNFKKAISVTDRKLFKDAFDALKEINGTIGLIAEKYASGQATKAEINLLLSGLASNRKMINDAITDMTGNYDLDASDSETKKHFDALKVASGIAGLVFVNPYIAVAGTLVSVLEMVYSNLKSGAKGSSEYEKYLNYEEPVNLSFNRPDNLRVTLHEEAGLNNVIGDGIKSNIIIGNDNDNEIKVISGNNNELYGGGGNDILIGSDEDDLLDGGINKGKPAKSDDDTYIYTDGHDTIQDYKIIVENHQGASINKYKNSGDDTLILRGIEEDEIAYYKKGTNLVIDVVNDNGKSVTINNYFSTDFAFEGESFIERLKFENDGNTSEVLLINDLKLKTYRDVIDASGKDNISIVKGKIPQLIENMSDDDTLHLFPGSHELNVFSSENSNGTKDLVIRSANKDDSISNFIDVKISNAFANDGQLLIPNVKMFIGNEEASTLGEFFLHNTSDEIAYTHLDVELVCAGDITGLWSNSDKIYFTDAVDKSGSKVESLDDVFNELGELVDNPYVIKFTNGVTKSLSQVWSEMQKLGLTTEKENTHHTDLIEKEGLTVNTTYDSMQYKRERENLIVKAFKGSTLLSTDRVDNFFVEDENGKYSPSGGKEFLISYTNKKNVNLVDVWNQGIDQGWIVDKNSSNSGGTVDVPTKPTENNNSNTNVGEDIYLGIISESTDSAGCVEGKVLDGKMYYKFSDVAQILKDTHSISNPQWQWDSGNLSNKLDDKLTFTFDGSSYTLFPNTGKLVKGSSIMKNNSSGSLIYNNKTMISEDYLNTIFGLRTTEKNGKLYAIDKIQSPNKYTGLYDASLNSLSDELLNDYLNELSDNLTTSNTESVGVGNDVIVSTSKGFAKELYRTDFSYYNNQYGQVMIDRWGYKLDAVLESFDTAVMVDEARKNFYEFRYNKKKIVVSCEDEDNPFIKVDDKSVDFDDKMSMSNGKLVVTRDIMLELFDLKLVSKKYNGTIYYIDENEMTSNVQRVFGHEFYIDPSTGKLTITKTHDFGPSKENPIDKIDNKVDAIRDGVSGSGGGVNHDSKNRDEDESEFVDGDSGSNKIRGYGGNDYLEGRGGNDKLYGNDGNDVLDGNSDNDKMYGNDGDDLFLADDGNDLYDGGQGDDIYVIHRSDRVTIDDYEVSGKDLDTVFFIDGDLETLDMTKLNDDLRVYFDEGDRNKYVTLNNFFKGTDYRPELYAFDENRQVLSENEFIQKYIEKNGNVINTGNQTINLTPGFGQKEIEIVSSDDLFLYHKTTRINLNEDISNIICAKAENENDLIILLKETNDTCVIKNYFVEKEAYVETLTFKGGTSWNDAMIRNHVYNDAHVLTASNDFINTTNSNNHNKRVYGLSGDDKIVTGSGYDVLVGGQGNDYLDGGAGNDTLSGGSGDDQLLGGSGNDSLIGGSGINTYIFSKGFGQDTIDLSQSENKDYIRFEDIRFEEVKRVRKNNDLVLEILESNDKITITNYFENNTSKLKGIYFSDNISIDSSTISETPTYISGDETGEVLTGDEKNNIIKGERGKDTITGGAGNDILDGGIDNDVLAGDTGKDILYGGAQNDILRGGEDEDYLYGGTGNDIQYGGSDNDYIEGGYGHDYLYGEDGDDYLDGNQGNDYLVGGKGDDVYSFTKGFGCDLIITYDENGHNGRETIQFEDINSDEIVLEMDTSNHSDLLIKINDDGDQIRIKNYFVLDDAYIDAIKFADGVTWEKDEIKRNSRILIVQEGTNDDNEIIGKDQSDTFDALYGFDGNDSLKGGKYDDYLYGGKGNDILIGGAGDDLLVGELGDDTYVFYKGLGRDTIILSSENQQDKERIIFKDITDEEVYFRTDLNNTSLSICVKETDDKIEIPNYYKLTQPVLNEIVFSNGLVWNKKMIEEKIKANLEIYGSNESDYLEGTNENDRFNGEDGNDYIVGKHGDDILTGGRGLDKIFGNSGSDTLYGDDGNDKLYGEDDNDIIYGGNHNDELIGGYGQDTLYGQEGNDSLIGGRGKDTLYGGDGDDELLGLEGNDELYGGKGSDKYYFFGNYGQDTIYFDGDVDDRIIFNDISSKEINVNAISTVYFIIGKQGEFNWLRMNHINFDEITNLEFEFSDGVVWNKKWIEGWLRESSCGWAGISLPKEHDNKRKIYGLPQNHDNLHGTESGDEIHGFSGNDTIYLSEGSDYLYGGSGKNTFIVENHQINSNKIVLEDNSDNQIVLKNISMRETELMMYDNYLLIGFKNSFKVRNGKGYENTLIINMDNYNETTELSIKFSDGELWDASYIRQTIEQFILKDDIDGQKISGSINDELILGNESDDILQGLDGNDQIYGGDGEDHIFGGAGDDILNGGFDNDILEGGAGKDTYYFTKEYGHDRIIFNEEVNDTIVFSDLRSDEVKVLGVEEEYFGLGDSNSKNVVVIDHINYAKDSLIIKFSDGIIWGNNDILNAINQYIEENPNTKNKLNTNRTIMDDAIVGLPVNNDILHGTDSNDEIFGFSGDDTFHSSRGDDILYGGRGRNQYIISGDFDSEEIVFDAYGEHKIVFKDLKKDDVELAVGTDRFIVHSPDVDKVLFIDLESYNEKNKVSIEFSDGTKWDDNDFRVMLDSAVVSKVTKAGDKYIGTDNNDIIIGYSTNDHIYGNNGDDVIYGTLGDDKLFGNEGNDTLYAGKGDDQIQGGAGDDRLYGGLGNNTYNLAGDFDRDTIFIEKNSVNNIFFRELLLKDLEIDITNNEIAFYTKKFDQLAIINLRNYTNETKINIGFADGEMWNDLKLKKVLNESVIRKTAIDKTGEFGTTLDDFIVGSRDQDIILGLLGNDVLRGGDGNDELYGGLGDDKLYSGEGRDKLYGGAGNNIYYTVGDGPKRIYIATDSQGVSVDTPVNDHVVIQSLSSQNAMMSFIGSDFVVTDSNVTTGPIINLDNFDENDSLTIEFNDGVIWSDDYLKKTIKKSNEYTQNSVNGVCRADDQDNTVIRLSNIKEIYGLGGDDILYGNFESSNLYGDDGDDMLYGGDGDDKLYGGNGDDVLYGGSYNDILNGGFGDDFLNGGFGRNQYIFEGDFGHDRVAFDIEGAHDFIFKDLEEHEINMYLDNDRLIFSSLNSESKVSVDLTTYSEDSKLSISLSDGLYLDYDDMRSITEKSRYYHSSDDNTPLLGTEARDILLGNTYDNEIIGVSGRIYGGPGDDILRSNAGDIWMIGGEGNDSLYGGEGNNVFLGAQGNDIIYGGKGRNNILVFNNNDIDTLHLDSDAENNIYLIDYQKEEITALRQDNDLHIIKDNENKIIVSDYYTHKTSLLDKLSFSDETLKLKTDIDNLVVNDKRIGKDIYTFDANTPWQFNKLYTDNEDLINLNYTNNSESSTKDNLLYDFKVTKESDDLNISYDNNHSFTVDDFFTDDSKQFDNLVVNDTFEISSNGLKLLIQSMNEYCSENGVDWTDQNIREKEDMQQMILSSFNSIA